MQRLFNDPGAVIDESIAGFVKCHERWVASTASNRALKYKFAPTCNKVGVVSGGGYGHDPAFMGYLGKYMLDAVAVGEIFEPPSSQAFYTAFKEADGGAGVICIYGNYPQDRESVEQAIKLAAADGITVKAVVVNEDVASTDPKTRRGMTGEVLIWKVGGAAAAQGYDLGGIVAVCEKALKNTRSIGIGLSSCTIPQAGQPNYIIERGTMEIGVGHHGFSSKDTCKLRTANTTAEIMLDEITKDMPLTCREQVVVMVSGLGGTMQCEMNILYSRIYDVLRNRGVEVHRAFVGNYFTSLDMMGVTLTIMKVDNELAGLVDLPAHPAAMSDFAAPAPKNGG